MLAPPFTVTGEEIDQIVERLGQTLEAVSEEDFSGV